MSEPLYTVRELTGTLKNGTKHLTGYIRGSGSISGNLSSATLDGYDTYDGEYVITPSPHEDISLDTKNKLLDGDITIEIIPYYETSNLSGGYTVYIGGD